MCNEIFNHRLRRSFRLVVLALSMFSAIEWSNAESVARTTFTRDVAPIFQGHCQQCHRPGQIAPMSLLTYEEARPWAKSIKREVMERAMPPFHAAGPLGQWLDDPRLTPEQIDTIVGWVDQGAPQGNPDDLPSPVEWPTEEWALGEPDRILELPKHIVREDNLDDYVYLFSDYVFPEDTWIRGIAWKFSDYKMVHHSIVFLLDADEEVPSGLKIKQELRAARAVNVSRGQNIGGWLPGTKERLLPEPQVLLIPKGKRIVCVLHCAPTTEAKSIQTSVGLYISTAEQHIVRKRLALRIDPATFYLRPNQSDVRIVRTGVFLEDALVTHYRAHMHYRGASTKMTYYYPDGTTETAIDIPQFDFAWQRFYYLTEPKRVPKGTVVEYVGVWDNSENNPNNPDPSMEVFFGQSTSDEMGSGTIDYVSIADLENLQAGTD